MFYVKERVDKTLKTLEKLMVSEVFYVTSFKKKSGNYLNPLMADSSTEPWEDYQTSQTWGGRDQNCWFQAEIKIPRSFSGKTVVMDIFSSRDGWDAINPQFMVFIDNNLVQGADVNHTRVFLSQKSDGSETYTIDLHAYSGMQDQKSDLKLSVGIFDVFTDRLFYDIKVLSEILNNLDLDSQDALRIQQALFETINKLDLRKPGSDLYHESVKLCLTYLHENYYDKYSGSKTPLATCVGHTHIDVAWLWTLDQTRQKVVRSFSTVLSLMEQYPEYIFMSSQPQLYRYLKQQQPKIYEKVREKIMEGRWEADGAMWVEADCNLASGESLIRQIFYGTRFFEKEFGVKNEILWLPDVFGYSAALPQILAESGIRYFMTTKISWNQFNKIPVDSFYWEGIDGTRILTHFITTCDYKENTRKDRSASFTTYNGYLNPSQVMGAWKRYQQKDMHDEVLISYGFGDGGGGPTRDMLENGRRMAKGIPGCPQVEMGTAGGFFHRLEETMKSKKDIPAWVGELYLEYHRGTYTSMAKNKFYNRKSEWLCQSVEFLSSFAMLMGGKYPLDALDDIWQIILLNQFHDIIPGSSIREVYDESHKQYEHVFNTGESLLENAKNSITKQISLSNESVVVFNTLSFERSDILEMKNLPLGSWNLTDSFGNCFTGQLNSDGKWLFSLQNVPAMGYSSYTLTSRESENVVEQPEINTGHLENKFYTVKLDEHGHIISLWDKTAKREVIKAGCVGNRILAFEDRPMNYDNWDIDIFYREKMWEVDQVVRMEITERGPVRICLEIEKIFLESAIIQKMYLYSDIPRIDFDTTIDWKQEQILLKVSFPVDIHSQKATYDIQFGNVERPTHWNTSWDYARFEVCAHEFADLSEDDYGISLMNDCKYGYDIKSGDMRLTLLKSGIDPNPFADKTLHHFVYSLLPHCGDWKKGNTKQFSSSLNMPLSGVLSKPQNGTLPAELSFMKIDSKNVFAETVKKAHDSDEIVVRFYEYFNRKTQVQITFWKDVETIISCDLMENNKEVQNCSGNEFSFALSPYQIKTYKIIFKNS